MIGHGYFTFSARRDSHVICSAQAAADGLGGRTVGFALRIFSVLTVSLVHFFGVSIINILQKGKL